MLKKQLVPAVLSGLLLASPLVMAEEAHHPEKATAMVEQGAGAGESAEAGGEAMPAGPGAIVLGGQQEGEAPPAGSTMGPGMMMGRGMGKGGCMMGMMRRGKMAGMQDGAGQGGMKMCHGGKMGMMHGGKGGGMKGCGCHRGGKGHGMHEKHRKLIGRLDLLEARLAKIETMLERLLQR